LLGLGGEEAKRRDRQRLGGIPPSGRAPVKASCPFHGCNPAASNVIADAGLCRRDKPNSPVRNPVNKPGKTAH
jgi:hypothetical protein